MESGVVMEQSIAIYIPQVLHNDIDTYFPEYSNKERCRVICLFVTYFYALYGEHTYNAEEVLDTIMYRSPVDPTELLVLFDRIISNNHIQLRREFAVIEILLELDICSLIDGHTTCSDCVFVIY